MPVNKIRISKKRGEEINNNMRIALSYAFDKERENGRDETSIFNKNSLKLFYAVTFEIFEELKEQSEKFGEAEELLEKFFETVRYVVKESVIARSDRRKFSKEKAEWFSSFFENMFGIIQEEDGEKDYFLNEIPVYGEKEGLVYYVFEELTQKYKLDENKRKGFIPLKN